MEEVWGVLISCFCSIIIYSLAHLPPWKLCQCSSTTTDFRNQWRRFASCSCSCCSLSLSSSQFGMPHGSRAKRSRCCQVNNIPFLVRAIFLSNTFQASSRLPHLAASISTSSRERFHNNRRNNLTNSSKGLFYLHAVQFHLIDLPLLFYQPSLCNKNVSYAFAWE